jgi:hypothetical protein
MRKMHRLHFDLRARENSQTYLRMQVQSQ